MNYKQRELDFDAQIVFYDMIMNSYFTHIKTIDRFDESVDEVTERLLASDFYKHRLFASYLRKMQIEIVEALDDLKQKQQQTKENLVEEAMKQLAPLDFNNLTATEQMKINSAIRFEFLKYDDVDEMILNDEALYLVRKLHSDYFQYDRRNLRNSLSALADAEDRKEIKFLKMEVDKAMKDKTNKTLH